MELPEYNITGHDYSRREHLTYQGTPIIDIHSHVTMTSPDEKPNGPSGGAGPSGSSDAAAQMLETGTEFGIGRIYTMCPPQDIAPLRKRFGDRLGFNGPISKKPEEPDDAAYRNLDQFLAEGIEIVKLWSAPRGRERGFFVDAPWRIEALKRARAAGVRIVMFHVGDPDVWWTHTYQDVAKFGTKADQYPPLYKMLEMFPDMIWIGAHMGGDPEHPDYLEEMLNRFPHLHFDTSATKWQAREVSARPEAIRSLVVRHADRFLFGSDLVTRHALEPEHYVSRYWCQRTLWESDWIGPSPIADPDYQKIEGGRPSPILRGVQLPGETLLKVYSDNARRLLKMGRI
ncbi:MAG: amidohydrolase [Planctomycetes bacterium]|nr:amidohydrolase [Planctomycetota bacterium]